VKFTHGSTSWQVTATKTVDLDPEIIEAAIQREFNLPWPNGERVGLTEDALRAWRLGSDR
jgi:ParB family transcriptional regulator, chromosome partitioning protein